MQKTSRPITGTGTPVLRDWNSGPWLAAWAQTRAFGGEHGAGQAEPPLGITVRVRNRIELHQSPTTRGVRLEESSSARPHHLGQEAVPQASKPMTRPTTTTRTSKRFSCNTGLIESNEQTVSGWMATLPQVIVTTTWSEVLLSVCNNEWGIRTAPQA